MYYISKQEPNFPGADSIGFGLFGGHGYSLRAQLEPLIQQWNMGLVRGQNLSPVPKE